ncbi:MAG: KOW motif-containing protein [Acidimicrobiales bacterium]
MARLKKGDKVIITEGDFTGRWGVITDKDLIGDEIRVALVGEDTREIRTHEAHVERVDGWPHAARGHASRSRVRQAEATVGPGAVGELLGGAAGRL